MGGSRKEIGRDGYATSCDICDCCAWFRITRCLSYICTLSDSNCIIHRGLGFGEHTLRKRAKRSWRLKLSPTTIAPLARLLLSSIVAWPRGRGGVDSRGGSLDDFDGVRGEGVFGSEVCGGSELGCMFSVSMVGCNDMFVRGKLSAVVFSRH
jgi:hypothetical protein